MLLDRITRPHKAAGKDELCSLRASLGRVCAESERRSTASGAVGIGDKAAKDGACGCGSCDACSGGSADTAGTGMPDAIAPGDLQSLDDGELADVGRLVWIAEYLAAKHHDKQHMRTIMGPLVDSIRGSADSIDVIEGDVQRLLLSAQTSLGRLQDMHIEMCRDDGPAAGSERAVYTRPPDGNHAAGALRGLHNAEID